MLAALVRLLAMAEARQRMRGYVRNLVTRSILLAIAGTAFLAATVFVLVGCFWALLRYTSDPVTSALIMAGILALTGLLIGIAAYLATKQGSRRGAKGRMRASSFADTGAPFPTTEEIGGTIERAVQAYGPITVMAAAVAGGFIAALLIKRQK